MSAARPTIASHSAIELDAAIAESRDAAWRAREAQRDRQRAAWLQADRAAAAAAGWPAPPVPEPATVPGITPRRGDSTRRPSPTPENGAQRRGRPAAPTSRGAARSAATAKTTRVDGSVLLSAPEVRALDNLLSHPTAAAILRRQHF